MNQPVAELISTELPLAVIVESRVNRNEEPANFAGWLGWLRFFDRNLRTDQAGRLILKAPRCNFPTFDSVI